MASANQRIRILLFASAREIAGKKEMEIDVDGNTTAGSLRKKIIEACPELSKIPFVLAVNRKVPANESVAINKGDEVAALPPISGG